MDYVIKIHNHQPPSWVPSIYDVSDYQRKISFNYINELTSEIGENVITTSKSEGSDISGQKVFHGTADIFEDSIRAGPKNIGKDNIIGGAGLYVAFEEGKDITRYYAKTAANYGMRKTESMTSEQKEGIKLSPDVLPKPIVLEGIINPEKEFGIGKFSIVEEGVPDLKNGILPADPTLRKVIENEFDILDIRIPEEIASRTLDPSRFPRHPRKCRK